MAWLCNFWLLLEIVVLGVGTSVLAQETNKAQPTLKIQILKIQNQKVKAEIAETISQQEKGLMFREVLGDENGMLFVFPDEAPRAFWMKNTFIDFVDRLF